MMQPDKASIQVKIRRFTQTYYAYLDRHGYDRDKDKPKLIVFGAKTWESAYTIARIKIPGFVDNARDHYKKLAPINSNLPKPQLWHHSNLQMVKTKTPFEPKRWAKIGEWSSEDLGRVRGLVVDLHQKSEILTVPVRKFTKLVRKLLNLKPNQPLLRLLHTLIGQFGWTYRVIKREGTWVRPESKVSTIDLKQLLGD